MTKLTRIIAPALIATLALGAAIPAQAYPAGGRSAEIGREIEQLQRAVARSDGRDRISEREAAGLRRDVRDLRQQYRAFAHDGLSPREYRILDRRIDQVRARLHVERRDRDHHRW